MRDPKRIKKIMALVQKIWYAYPDLRFGHKIGKGNISSDGFYVEDDEIIDRLKDLAKRLSG